MSTRQPAQPPASGPQRVPDLSGLRPRAGIARIRCSDGLAGRQSQPVGPARKCMGGGSAMPRIARICHEFR